MTLVTRSQIEVWKSFTTEFFTDWLRDVTSEPSPQVQGRIWVSEPGGSSFLLLLRIKSRRRGVYTLNLRFRLLGLQRTPVPRPVHDSTRYCTFGTFLYVGTTEAQYPRGKGLPFRLYTSHFVETSWESPSFTDLTVLSGSEIQGLTKRDV